jgi:ribosomal protein S18 acetylase RimI-like enzyme
MTECRDWRGRDAGEARPLVEAEIQAWRSQLAWDVAEPWSAIEPARLAGHLPGLISFDGSGRPSGWTAYLPHQGHLQVMALVAPDVESAAALLDGTLASDEARSARSTLFCVRDATPGLREVLASRGFTVETYRYLSNELVAGRPPAHGFERWHGHEAAMAGLCANAYRSGTGVRAFAPGGTITEWRHYVHTLTHGTGCGWFLPEFSLVASSGVGGPLRGGVMLTDLNTGTVHVAQVAVDPAERGRGLGRELIDASLGAAAVLYRRVTLLVAASNVPAVRLYESMGFTDAASFVVASRENTAPTRSDDDH